MSVWLFWLVNQDWLNDRLLWFSDLELLYGFFFRSFDHYWLVIRLLIVAYLDSYVLNKVFFLNLLVLFLSLRRKRRHYFLKFSLLLLLLTILLVLHEENFTIPWTLFLAFNPWTDLHPFIVNDTSTISCRTPLLDFNITATTKSWVNSRVFLLRIALIDSLNLRHGWNSRALSITCMELIED